MKRSLKDHSSYLIVDHTNSPGISESDIPLPLRGIVIPIPSGEILERDIQFCAHCGSQVVLNPLRERPRGYCAKCDHYICDNPICHKECIPLAKILDKNAILISKGD